MSLSFRRATSFLLLAVIGTVAMLGENLHLLGGGHHGDCFCAAPCHEHCHDHAASHDHAIAETARAEHSERANLAVSCDACPICQFLAQFRLIDPPAAEIAAAGWTSDAPLARRQLAAVKRSRRDLARGPPAPLICLA
jgi:hypothetical protein